MKLDKNLIEVLEMMLTRIEEKGNGSFGIPGDLAPRDQLSQEELNKLEDAGFVWHDSVYEGGGWLLDLLEQESINKT